MSAVKIKRERRQRGERFQDTEADIFYSEPSVLKENEILLIILILNNKLKTMIHILNLTTHTRER